LYELESVLHQIGSEKLTGNSVLEIGGGSGWQAKKLAEKGYSIEVIDIPDSIYSAQRVWPILDYDGRHIPFPDGRFDIVFSSSVLEHIPHVHEFQSEIQRVLKTGGIAIHIVPSGSWRFWTNVAHYPFIIKIVTRMIYNKMRVARGCKNVDEIERAAMVQVSRLPKLGVLKKAIFPPRHGEIGNSLSEIYYFSRNRWFDLFKRTGWKIEEVSPNGLFYTGHMILGSAVSLEVRRYLSHILGSSCHFFILKKSCDR
jgi:SAM-dependent methyltransferase